MNEMQVKEEIRLIREMIEKTKQTVADYWKIFFCWGLVGILGVVGMYALVFVERYEWIWFNWVVFVGLGVLYTMVYRFKKEELHKIRTYTATSISYLSIGCGIAFILVGFIFPLLDLYSWGVIPVLISLIAGILAFVEGGIIEWNLLKWCGVIWWLGAIGMVFIHENYRALFFVPLIIIGYLVPGFIFRSAYRKKQI